MKLLIDDAGIDKIKRMYDFYPVDGVTTNPSILAKAGEAPFVTLHRIREVIGPTAELHVQVTASDVEGMIRDARRICQELGENTFIKIPAVPEGFRAMRLLSGKRFLVTATAVYSPMQAFLAAKSGARYVAPYVNRIDNLGYDGVAVAKDIHEIFRANGLECQVLAASFKNSQQVLELCRCGVGACTLAPEVMENLVKNPVVDAAVEVFLSDFAGLAGQGVTMWNC